MAPQGVAVLGLRSTAENDWLFSQVRTRARQRRRWKSDRNKTVPSKRSKTADIGSRYDNRISELNFFPPVVIVKIGRRRGRLDNGRETTLLLRQLVVASTNRNNDVSRTAARRIRTGGRILNYDAVAANDVQVTHTCARAPTSISFDVGFYFILFFLRSPAAAVQDYVIQCCTRTERVYRLCSVFSLPTIAQRRNERERESEKNVKKKKNKTKKKKRQERNAVQMVLTVSPANSGCSTGLVDKRSPRPTTPGSAPAPRLSAARTRPLLCAQAPGTVDVHRPPDT